jgi:hypothetical protein
MKRHTIVDMYARFQMYLSECPPFVQVKPIAEMLMPPQTAPMSSEQSDVLDVLSTDNLFNNGRGQPMDQKGTASSIEALDQQEVSAKPPTVAAERGNGGAANIHVCKLYL